LETLELRPIKSAPGVPPWPIGFAAGGREFLFSEWNGKNRVAFDLATGLTRDIFSAEDLARIAAAPDLAREYDLSPDQAAVVYVARDGNEQQLIVADPHFQSRRIIARVTQPEGISAPRWSPDRTRVAYYMKEPGATAHDQLRIVAADGSWQRTVDTGQKYVSGGAIAPHWSPDGTRLAVTLGEDRTGEVGVLENFLPATLFALK
jgi:dipeptidyl aminopeptidase/acylaminoacyl peptidase